MFHILSTFKKSQYPSLIRLLRIFILIVLLADFFIASAQLPLTPQAVYEIYTSENSSLPANTLYKVIAAEDGYLWICTDKGLVKYNGKTFELVDLGAREDVVSGYVIDNKLLLQCYNGDIKLVNLNTHKVINVDSLWGLKKAVNRQAPYLLAWNEQDQLYLTKKYLAQTNDQKIQEYVIVNLSTGKSSKSNDPKVFFRLMKAYPLDINKSPTENLQELITGCHFRSRQIMFDEDIVMLNNQLFNRNQKGAVSFFDGNKMLEKEEQISCGLRVGDDLWVGTHNSGLLVYENYYAPKKGIHITMLLKDFVSSICADKVGNVWVSLMKNGLVRIPLHERKSIFYQNPGFKDGKIAINKLYFNDGQIGLLNNDASELILYSKSEKLHDIKYKSPQFGHLGFLNNQYFLYQNNGKIYNFLNSKNSKIRDFSFSNWENNVHYYWKDGQKYKDKYFTLETCGNIVWLSSNKKGVYSKRKYGSTTFQPLNDSIFLFGTTYGIYLLEQKLPWLTNVRFNKIRQLGKNLICCTEDGTYCIDTGALFNTEKLAKITEIETYDVQGDKNYLYLRTTEGILIFDNKLQNIIKEINFLKFSIPFVISDFYVDSKYIIVTGNKGVLYLEKESELNSENKIPPIYIINNKTGYRNTQNFYQETYSKGLSFKFNIEILDFKKSDKQISIRVTKGSEQYIDWQKTNEKASYLFSVNEPGDYIIEYNIVSIDGSWSKNIKYKIHIIPLWFQKAEVRFLILLFILIVCVFFYWWFITLNNKRTLRNLKAKLRIYELESHALAAQLDPHFIFNAMVPLQVLTNKGEKEATIAYISTFSKLMRIILKNSRVKTLALAEEINFIQYYLKVQQEVYNKSFTYDVCFKRCEKIDSVFIPSMLFQPILENAIVHGVSKLSYIGHIDVVLSMDKDSVRVFIRDNGKGLPRNFTIIKDHALNIIQDRINLIRQISGLGSMHIYNNLGQVGTTIEIILPLNYQIK